MCDCIKLVFKKLKTTLGLLKKKRITSNNLYEKKKKNGVFKECLVGTIINVGTYITISMLIVIFKAIKVECSVLFATTWFHNVSHNISTLIIYIMRIHNIIIMYTLRSY